MGERRRRSYCEKCGADFGHYGYPSTRYIQGRELVSQELIRRVSFGKDEFLLRECLMCEYKWKEPVMGAEESSFELSKELHDEIIAWWKKSPYDGVKPRTLSEKTRQEKKKYDLGNDPNGR